MSALPGVTTKASPRVGLLGNPADYAEGKGISFTFTNFEARCFLQPSPVLQILGNHADVAAFASLKDVPRQIELDGYYGGVRLLKAAVVAFVDHCNEQQLDLGTGNFALAYWTSIPRQVGLGGSSAIIVAALRGLAEFYGLQNAITASQIAHLAWRAEAEMLGIQGGFQDQCVQAHEGCLFMHFGEDLLNTRVEALSPSLLPSLFVAYDVSSRKETTTKFHSDFTERVRKQEPSTVEALRALSENAVEGGACLRQKDLVRFGQLMDENFELRLRIKPDINREYQHMVRLGQQLGAHVKFTGGGGAVVATYESQEHLEELQRAYAEAGCTVVCPIVQGQTSHL
jgi:glucuronokinase